MPSLNRRVCAEGLVLGAGGALPARQAKFIEVIEVCPMSIFMVAAALVLFFCQKHS